LAKRGGIKMEFENPTNRKYKKISISIDTDILDQLRKERQDTGTTISGNITKALKHKREQTAILIDQQEQIEILKKLITENNQKITQKETEIQNKELELQEKEKELEAYNKQKNKGYFEKVIRAVFNLND